MKQFLKATTADSHRSSLDIITVNGNTQILALHADDILTDSLQLPFSNDESIDMREPRC